MPTARPARADDLPAIGEVLARSFDDDPVMAFILPPRARRRQARMRAFMLMGATRALGLESLYAVGNGDGAAVRGAAVWLPPRAWKTPASEMLRQAPTMLRVLRARIPAALRLLQLIEKKHPREPHWYLEILGTDPDHQGKGVGGAAMEPVLTRCDREGLGAYLESSKERNVPYYRSHGFEVTEEVRPEGGPPLWLMWRDPRSS